MGGCVKNCKICFKIQGLKTANAAKNRINEWTKDYNILANDIDHLLKTSEDGKNACLKSFGKEDPRKIFRENIQKWSNQGKIAPILMNMGYNIYSWTNSKGHSSIVIECKNNNNYKYGYITMQLVLIEKKIIK